MATAEPTRPYLWEKNYPEGVRWDAPLNITTVTDLFEHAAVRFAERPALTFSGKTLSFREQTRCTSRVFVPNAPAILRAAQENQCGNARRVILRAKEPLSQPATRV